MRSTGEVMAGAARRARRTAARSAPPGARAAAAPAPAAAGCARISGVIVALHVASGALAGALAGSRVRAAGIGPLLHAGLDAIPHEDIPSRRFEEASGIAALLLLASRRGIDAAVVGGALSAAPDLEHVLPLPKPGGKGLFPSHRLPHSGHARVVPAWAQLAVAVAIVAALVARSGR